MRKKPYLSLMSGCFMGLVSYSMADGNTADLPQFAAGAIPSTANPTYKNMCSDCTLPGIYQWGGGLPVYGDNVTINEAGYMGHGIYVNGDTAGLSVGTVLGNGLSVTTSKDNADGLRTMGNQSVAENPTFIVVGDNARIVTTGYSADGINAGYTSYSNGYKGSANITLGNRAYIETSGGSAYGVSASAVNKDAVNNVTLGDDAKIITHGSSSIGVRAGGIGTTIKVGDRTNITTHGDYAHAVSASSSSNVTIGDNSSLTTNGKQAHGVSASGSSTVDIGDNLNIVTNGVQGHGVYSTSNSVINVGKNATITTNSDYISTAVYAAGGAINLSGGTFSSVGKKTDGVYAMMASGATIKGENAVYHIKGNLASSGNKGLLNLDMAAGSTWEGAAYVSSFIEGNKITMNLTDWLMTDSSSVNILNDTNSNIRFKSSVDNFLDLIIWDLQGTGTTFGMNVDLGGINTAVDANGEIIGTAGKNGDLLRLGSVDNGKYKLNVANVGSAETRGNEVLQVVKVLNGSNGNFSLSNGPVELGAYEYGLRTTNGDDGWELYGTGKRTSTATNMPALLNTNYLVNYVDTQNLLQRMGELRNKGEGDVWMRGFGGKLNSFAGQNVAGFNMNYKGTQAGVDKRLDTKSGQAYVGVMGGMTEGSTHSNDANGTIKDYHLGVYGSYVADNGIYLDAVAKYSHMKNSVSIKTGAKSSGKGSSDGYSASLETGKRFHLGADKKSGVYVEPQAQLTVGHQDSMSMTASNGLKTELDGYNYAIARASAVVGYETKGKNPINVYAKTGYAKEMNGKTSYKLNGQKNNYNFSGSWWDNSIGVSANVNKKHSIYTDLSYAKGKRFDQKQLNVGYRYSF